MTTRDRATALFYAAFLLAVLAILWLLLWVVAS